jgi:hypothetical protein
MNSTFQDNPVELNLDVIKKAIELLKTLPQNPKYSLHPMLLRIKCTAENG